VTGLTALETQFADGHVPLGLILGAIGALSAVKNCFPDATSASHVSSSDAEQPLPIEVFVALLLGVVAMHERLTMLVERSDHSMPRRRHDRQVVTADSLAGIAR
jgi:hypothetical protein